MTGFDASVRVQDDWIAATRSALGADPGSMERESALLAMLVAMDGIHGNLEQVRGRGV